MILIADRHLRTRHPPSPRPRGDRAALVRTDMIRKSQPDLPFDGSCHWPDRALFLIMYHPINKWLSHSDSVGCLGTRTRPGAAPNVQSNDTVNIEKVRDEQYPS